MDSLEADHIPYFLENDQENFISTWENSTQLPHTDSIACPEPDAFGLGMIGLDQKIYDILELNWDHIRTKIIRQNVQSIYVLRTPIFSSLLLESLKAWLRAIYLDQKESFKINISFSYLLSRSEEDTLEAQDGYSDLRIFLGTQNGNLLFPVPPLVIDRESMDLVLENLSFEDMIQNCQLSRDSTRWRFLTFLSMVVFVNHIPNVALGAPTKSMSRTDLPAYIRNDKNIVSLLHDDPGKDTLALCVFRALAVFQSGKSQNYENLARENYRKYQKFLVENQFQPKAIPLRKFKGVTLEQFDKIERCFNLKIQIWILEENEQEKKPLAKVIRHPSAINSQEIQTQQKILHLLQFESHVMLVKNPKKLSRQFVCHSCEAVFASLWLLNRHTKSTKAGEACSKGMPKEIFQGGARGRAINLWDRVSANFGVFVPISLRFYYPRITFDLETFTPERSSMELETEDSSSVQEQTDQYLDENIPDQDASRMTPQYRPECWTSDHESPADYGAKDLGDALSGFLKKHWNEYSSDRSLSAEKLRIRTCFPPTSRDDVEIALSANGIPTILNEEATIFRPTADQIYEFLSCGLTLTSREIKSDVTGIDFRLILAVENQETLDYEIFKTPFYFQDTRGLALAIPEWKQALRAVEKALPSQNFQQLYTNFVHKSLADPPPIFIGLLGIEFEMKSQRLTLLYKQVPLSCAACGNFTNFNVPKFWLNTNEQDPEAGAKTLVDNFVEYLHDASRQASILMKVRLRPYLNTMKLKLETYRKLHQPFSEKVGRLMKDKKMRKKAAIEAVVKEMIEEGADEWAVKEISLAERTYRLLNNLYGQVQKFLQQLPVIGFNSGGFDLPVIRNYLMENLMARYQDTAPGKKINKQVSCIMRNQRYLCLQTPNLIFLDAFNYSAPTSLDSFLASWDLPESERKLHLPYEYMTISRLRLTEIPEIRHWRSWLRKQEMSPDKYEEIKKFWQENQVRDLGHYLELYNTRDITGLATVLEKMYKYWTEIESIDPFKSGFLSLSGLSFESMFRYLASTKPFEAMVQVYNQKNSDLYYKMRESIVAGPSIIFNRCQIAGESTLPSGEPVASIQGFDSNSLYPSCFLQPLPTGVGIRLEPQKAPVENSDNSGDVEQVLMDLLDSNETADSDQAAWPLESTFFKMSPTELFYKGATEYLAYTTAKYRSQNICADHEPISKMYSASELKIGPLWIAPDSFCPRCRLLQNYNGCRFHGHSWEECKFPNARSRFESMSAADQEEWLQRQARTKRVQDYFTKYSLFKDFKYEVVYECEWLQLRGKIPSRRAFADPDVIRFCEEKFPDLEYSLNGLSGQDLLERVRDGSFTGYIRLDIHTPEHLKPIFDRFPVIFGHREISRDDLTPEMLDYAVKNGHLKRPQKLLCSTMNARQVLLLSTYVKTLLDFGCQVSNISWAVYYRFAPIFREYFDRNLKNRMLAQEAGQSGRANTEKLKSNSAFGSCCMDRTRHRDVFFTDQKTASKLMLHPRFRHLTSIVPGKIYQLTMAKKSITLSVPVHIAVAILNLAKVELIKFYWLFLDRFFGPRMEASFIDTDSVYFACATDHFDDLVPEHLREEYEQVKANVLAILPEHKYLPGRWKPELSDGTHFIATSSKTYFIERKHNPPKYRAKGVQKATNTLRKEDFLNAVKEKGHTITENRGFKIDSQTGAVRSYRLSKKSVHFFYCKRSVTPNGIHTHTIDL